jgi:hypothetical protein
LLLIIRESNNFRRGANSVINILIEFELDRLSFVENSLESNAYPGAPRSVEELKFELKILRAVIPSLDIYRRALCDFLEHRAFQSTILYERFSWKEGDEIPKITKDSSKLRKDWETPKEFICPVSHKVMDNPMQTCNGETYDRKAITE